MREIEGDPTRVMKLYHHPPTPAKTDKLRAMAEGVSPQLLKIAAWPTDLVLTRSQQVCGFIMPAVRARRDIHELYSPRSRYEAFPTADFRFLVHVATNIARAFAVVHDHGHVIGDVNHGSVLVGPPGTVVLIDCDSFQVRRGPRTFTCDVGVPLFTPPELQGHSFRELLRTADHDAFGLAVLLFHLLFMGRHPFAGRFTEPGEMPIERAIREGRFAYGPPAVSRGMQRPPGTLPLDVMGKPVAELFMAALVPRTHSAGRPTARDWIEPLRDLEQGLRACTQSDSHFFPGQLVTCPWCTLEPGMYRPLFGSKITATAPHGTVDVRALWRAIEAVPDPGPDPTVELSNSGRGRLIRATTLKIARAAASLTLLVAGFAACNAPTSEIPFLLTLFLYGLGLAVWPRQSVEKIQTADRQLRQAREHCRALEKQFRAEASQQAFFELRSQLERTRIELEGLPAEKARRMQQLHRDREHQQRRRYLDRFRIERARIRKIGRGRTAMLASYGVETAADVDYHRICQIPGFGPVLAQELTTWRSRVEVGFRFDAQKPVDPQALRDLERHLINRQESLLAELRRGPAALQHLHQRILANRPGFLRALQTARQAVRAAEVERRAL